MGTRRLAAKISQVNVDCLLLKSWRDLKFLIDNPPIFKGEVYSELIEGLPKTFNSHYSFICEEARRFRDLKSLQQQKSFK